MLSQTADLALLSGAEASRCTVTTPTAKGVEARAVLSDQNSSTALCLGKETVSVISILMGSMSELQPSLPYILRAGCAGLFEIELIFHPLSARCGWCPELAALWVALLNFTPA